MIRNLTLLSLFFLNLAAAFSQNTGKLFYLDDNNRLATLDPNTALSTPVSPAGVFSGGLLPGAVAVDQEGNRFFLATIDSTLGAELVSVSLDNGEILSTAALAITPGFLEYNCQNGLLYTIDGENNLLSIEPESGTVELITLLNSPNIDLTTPSLDPYNNRLFYITIEALGIRLSAVSIETGEVLLSQDIGDDIVFRNMKYNCRDGLLYGLLGQEATNFARIDPQNGITAPLSGPIAENGFLPNSQSLSQNRQAYTFLGLDENSTARLYTLSLATGTILSQPGIGTEFFLNNFMDYANRCSPAADFGLAVSCANDTTRFTNTSTPGASFLWNFGDPASGAANTSTEPNPTHVYTNPGTYTITLIATDCGADTLSKVVEVPGLAAAPFGDTTLACEDDFPLALNAQTDGATYLWQNGTTDSTFIVESADVPLEVTVQVTLGACTSEYTTVVDRDEDANCPCLLDLPNAFTPNGDGHNDFFQPVERNCRIKAGSYTLRVYNRWGEMVFEGIDPDANGWDGNHKSNPAPSEVYFYTLQYISETDLGDMPMERQGDLTLLR